MQTQPPVQWAPGIGLRMQIGWFQENSEPWNKWEGGGAGPLCEAEQRMSQAERWGMKGVSMLCALPVQGCVNETLPADREREHIPPSALLCVEISKRGSHSLGAVSQGLTVNEQTPSFSSEKFVWGSGPREGLPALEIPVNIYVNYPANTP